jgi:hypothetical protein
MRYIAGAPFLIAAILVVLMLLSPLSGIIGPSSNTFFVLAGSTILAGVSAGVIALLMMRSLRPWVRLLIGLCYIPTVVFSLLLSGF